MAWAVWVTLAVAAVWIAESTCKRSLWIIGMIVFIYLESYRYFLC